VVRNHHRDEVLIRELLAHPPKARAWARWTGRCRECVGLTSAVAHHQGQDDAGSWTRGCSSLGHGGHPAEDCSQPDDGSLQRKTDVAQLEDARQLGSADLIGLARRSRTEWGRWDQAIRP
jgi:hypothetical protein